MTNEERMSHLTDEELGELKLKWDELSCDVREQLGRIEAKRAVLNSEIVRRIQAIEELEARYGQKSP
jgi:hypothetical protein